MPAARYWRAIGLQPYAGKALELSALHLYTGAANAFRYWRFTNITVSGGTFLAIGELQLLSNEQRLGGATISASSAPPAEAIERLNDNDLLTRTYWSAGVAQDPNFWIQLDFGAPVEANGVRQSGFDTNDRHMTSFALSASNDGANWTQVAMFSGLPHPGTYTYSAVYPFSTGSGGDSVRVDAAATITSTISPTTGALVNLQDADTNSVCRWAHVSAPGFALQWDFGSSPQDVGAVRLGGGALQNEFLEAVTLQSSSDGEMWSSGANLGRFAWPGAGAMTDASAEPLARIVRPSGSTPSMQLSGGMAGNAGTALPPTTAQHDLQDGGRHRLYGTVELKGTPNLLLRRRVQLWNQRDKRMVRETWSDATTGAWSFDYIRGGDGTRYCAVTYDHTGQKQAQIADNLEPEAM